MSRASDRWEEMYRGREQVFSGRANPVLVAEAADLEPGHALDVGCGEGGDALWLAQRGWRVTAVDIAPTAVKRAAAAGLDVAHRVEWRCADLVETPPPAGAFDLVSVHFFPLPRQPDHAALHGLLDALAPGGTFLFGTHDIADFPPYDGKGNDPRDYYQPDQIAPVLGDGWTVLVNERRRREGPTAPGTHHTHDTVLRARRDA